MEVFGHNHAVPFSKMLTFYRSSPFVLTASYSLPPPYYPQTRIGTANLFLFISDNSDLSDNIRFISD